MANDSDAANNLSYFPGDPIFRRRVFEPLLARTNGGHAIYHERFARLVAIEDFQADAQGFSARAIPIQTVRGMGLRVEAWEKEPWTFSSSWSLLCQHPDSSLNSPYAGWSLWTDPWLVAKIMRWLEEDPADHRRVVRLLRGPSLEPLPAVV